MLSSLKAFMACLAYVALFGGAAYFSTLQGHSSNADVQRYHTAPTCDRASLYGCRATRNATVKAIIEVPGGADVVGRLALDVTLATGEEQSARFPVGFPGRNARSLLEPLHTGDQVSVEMWDGRVTRVQSHGRNVTTLDLPAAQRSQWKWAVIIASVLAVFFAVLAVASLVRGATKSGRPRPASDMGEHV